MLMRAVKAPHYYYYETTRGFRLSEATILEAFD